MKKILALAFMACLVTVGASAQTKAVLTTKINTPTLQCEMGKKMVEDLLHRYDGVITVNVNLRQKFVMIKYLTDRTNEEILKTAIANAGFDANEIAANPDSYKALPKDCKKPEDGGPSKPH